MPWKKGSSSTNDSHHTVELHIELCKYIHIIMLHKTQLQMDQRPHHKVRYTGPERRECREQS